MIVGIGTDIMEIDRFNKTIERFGENITTKLFTKSEITYCRSHQASAKCFALHFAAKEALSKAIATGNTGIFRWKDVEVMYPSSGAPTLKLHNALHDQLQQHKTSLTLSETALHVMAFVTIESADD